MMRQPAHDDDGNGSRYGGCSANPIATPMPFNDGNRASSTITAGRAASTCRTASTRPPLRVRQTLPPGIRCETGREDRRHLRHGATSGRTLGRSGQGSQTPGVLRRMSPRPDEGHRRSPQALMREESENGARDQNKKDQT